MKKNYISPELTCVELLSEAIMLSTSDNQGNGKQLGRGKRNFEDEDNDNTAPARGRSAWDE